jgi:hypothetical protein
MMSWRPLALVAVCVLGLGVVAQTPAVPQLIDRQKAIDAITALPTVTVPPKESCNPDGTPNGVDEDQDGATDEICKGTPPTPPPCVFTVAPLTLTLPATAGSGSLAVTTAPAGCAPATWTATSSAPWMTVTAQAPSTATWAAEAAMAASTRTATLTVATQSVAVTQAGLTTPTSGAPSSWTDARFAGNVSIGPMPYASNFTRAHFDIIDPSGNPSLGCQNFTAQFFRIDSREGVRVCGGDVLIEDFYLKVKGLSNDHADGIQHYIGRAGTTLKDRNGKTGYQLIARRGVIAIDGVCTAGLFSADGSKGRIWLEDVTFTTTTGCKGLRVNVDGGGPVSCVRCVFQNAPQVDVSVDVWENNTLANGTPVARPGGAVRAIPKKQP